LLKRLDRLEKKLAAQDRAESAPKDGGSLK
jgi:hypothetical protein